MDLILTPILCVVHLAAAYVIPIVATLRSQSNGQRWIIHWILFIALRLTVFRVFDFLFSGAIYWLLIVASELGLLFALAQHVNLLIIQSEAVKSKLLEVVDQATVIAKRYIEIVKKQIEKVSNQSTPQTAQ